MYDAPYFAEFEFHRTFPECWFCYCVLWLFSFYFEICCGQHWTRNKIQFRSSIQFNTICNFNLIIQFYQSLFLISTITGVEGVIIITWVEAGANKSITSLILKKVKC